MCGQIVHLKRFQSVGGRWVKSQKVVNFPFKDFDPTDYLASVPRQTVSARGRVSGIWGLFSGCSWAMVSVFGC